jgi:AraC-like DNA-binding protein
VNSSSRIVFGSGKRGGHHLLPEILETGWGNFATADSGHLRPHAHAGAFEFCFILSGEVEWNTADSSDILREGDIYVTQPDEIHWGRDAAMHPCTLHWLILGSPGCGFNWRDMDQELAGHLDSRLRNIQTHRLRGTSKLAGAFSEIFEEHVTSSGSKDQMVLQQGNARASLHRLLIELVRTHDRHMALSDARGGLPPATARAIEILHGSAHDPNVVRRICELTGTDYKKLNRQFVEHLGTTLSQYWLRERVRLARERLLKTNVTITDVATEFGFSSSQHFATVFRKITGLTPSEYRSNGVAGLELS